MKSFKSLVVSTLTAASTVMAVAVSTPAQACPLCGGVRLNGIELNGLRVNGPIRRFVSPNDPTRKSQSERAASAPRCPATNAFASGGQDWS